jgi:predicted transcriptional regulator YheO
MISEQFLDSFLDNIGQLFGNRCEIVVHDFTEGLEHTVVKIIHGELSGRAEGACPSSLFFQQYPSLSAITEDKAVYFNQVNGRIFKSSSTFIRDGNGNVAGAVCVNLDVTEEVRQQRELAVFLAGYSGTSDSVEVFYKNVSEMMDFYLTQAERQVGKSAAEMTKAEKKEALAYLDECGILQIAKSSVRLCRFFDISKYTLYTWLEEIRSRMEKESEG